MNTEIEILNKELFDALEGILNGLADDDEEGLLEHVPEIEYAREIQAKAKAFFIKKARGED